MEHHPSHVLTDVSTCENCKLEESKLGQPCEAIGYHRRKIKKGVLGEVSKIQEELDELKDAEEQGVTIMALVELSDLVGAVQAYLEAKHPSVTLDDLREMSGVTRRAFRNGRRS